MRHDAQIGRFVERQMRNWELAKQQVPLPAAQELPKVKFYITLSRETGCRGEPIADCLAKRLGWQKFDREILEYMAGNATARRRLFTSLDEGQKNWMDDLLQPLVPEGMTGRSDYFAALTRAILAICYYQHAIIVGRGANFVLPPDQGLRVRLVAPLLYRVAHVAHTENLTPRQARKRLQQVESARAKFTAGHFGRFPYDPRNYDLVINTMSLNDQQTCDLIIAAARTKAGREDLDR
jgi:cytidylate kinase